MVGFSSVWDKATSRSCILSCRVFAQIAPATHRVDGDEHCCSTRSITILFASFSITGRLFCRIAIHIGAGPCGRLSRPGVARGIALEAGTRPSVCDSASVLSYIPLAEEKNGKGFAASVSQAR
jgi:hypothetical protein